MKRKGKVIFLSIAVVILLIIIFNFNEIKFGLNMAKSYNQEPVEEKELTESEKQLLEGSRNPLIIILEKEGIDVEDESSEENTDSDNENKEDKDKDIESKEEQNTKNETEYTKTIVKYNNEFSSLQSEFESKLSGLISQGYSEYKSGVSAGKLAPKYLSKGADLEGECDRKFYTMLGQLEDELNASKQDTGVISDLKNYYNSYKDAKRGEIMDKARGHL